MQVYIHSSDKGEWTAEQGNAESGVTWLKFTDLYLFFTGIPLETLQETAELLNGLRNLSIAAVDPTRTGLAAGITSGANLQEPVVSDSEDEFGDDRGVQETSASSLGSDGQHPEGR